MAQEKLNLVTPMRRTFFSTCMAALLIPTLGFAAPKPSVEVYPEALQNLKKAVKEQAQKPAPAPTPAPVATVPEPIVIVQPDKKPVVVMPLQVDPFANPAPYVTTPAAPPAPPAPAAPPSPPEATTKPASVDTKSRVSGWLDGIGEAIDGAATSVGEAIRELPAPTPAETPAKPTATTTSNINQPAEQPEVKTAVDPTPPPPAAAAVIEFPAPTPPPPSPVAAPANPNLPSMNALIGDEQTQKEAVEREVKAAELPKTDENATQLTAGEIKPTPKPETKKLKSEAKPVKKPEPKPAVKAEPKKLEQQVPPIQISAQRVPVASTAEPPPAKAPEPSKPAPDNKAPLAALEQPKPIAAPAAIEPPPAVAPPEPIAPPTTSASASIKFADGSREITPDAGGRINAIADRTKGTSKKVAIVGYGNSKIQNWRKDALAQVLAVRAALIEKGVTATNISVLVKDADQKANQVDMSVN